MPVRVQVPPSVQMKSSNILFELFLCPKLKEIYLCKFWHKKTLILNECFSQNDLTGLIKDNSRLLYKKSQDICLGFFIIICFYCFASVPAIIFIKGLISQVTFSNLSKGNPSITPSPARCFIALAKLSYES